MLRCWIHTWLYLTEVFNNRNHSRLQSVGYTIYLQSWVIWSSPKAPFFTMIYWIFSFVCIQRSLQWIIINAYNLNILFPTVYAVTRVYRGCNTKAKTEDKKMNKIRCCCQYCINQQRTDSLCTLLSLQQNEAIEKAQAEIQRLRLERERYEESMKKAFMRGVCALNMEALGMFITTEGRAEQLPAHDQHGLWQNDLKNSLKENILTAH